MYTYKCICSGFIDKQCADTFAGILADCAPPRRGPRGEPLRPEPGGAGLPGARVRSAIPPFDARLP